MSYDGDIWDDFPKYPAPGGAHLCRCGQECKSKNSKIIIPTKYKTTSNTKHNTNSEELQSPGVQGDRGTYRIPDERTPNKETVYPHIPPLPYRPELFRNLRQHVTYSAPSLNRAVCATSLLDNRLAYDARFIYEPQRAWPVKQRIETDRQRRNAPYLHHRKLFVPYARSSIRRFSQNPIAGYNQADARYDVMPVKRDASHLLWCYRPHKSNCNEPEYPSDGHSGTRGKSTEQEESGPSSNEDERKSDCADCPACVSEQKTAPFQQRPPLLHQNMLLAKATACQPQLHTKDPAKPDTMKGGQSDLSGKLEERELSTSTSRAMMIRWSQIDVKEDDTRLSLEERATAMAAPAGFLPTLAAKNLHKSAHARDTSRLPKRICSELIVFAYEEMRGTSTAESDSSFSGMESSLKKMNLSTGIHGGKHDSGASTQNGITISILNEEEAEQMEQSPNDNNCTVM